MKRILSLILCLATLFSLFALAGCKDKKKEEKEAEKGSSINLNPTKEDIIYSTVDLSEYIDLSEYKGLKVDTSSKEFKEYYDAAIENDITSNDFYVKKYSGKVENGDTANIDYVGKLDGKAFDGGTYEGYDLKIGSGTFIPGFETALIGKSVGKTYDIDLTFPENYGNEELNGKDVVFTVKINYIKTDEKRKPADYYKDLDYKSLKEYEDAVTESAVKNFLLNSIIDSSKTKNYPQKELELLAASYIQMVEENIKSQYNASLEDYLTANGQNFEDYYNSMVDEQIKPVMDSQMVIFGIIQNENVSVTKEDVEAKIDELMEQIDDEEVKREDVISYYGGEYYFEYLIGLEKALDIVYSNAVIS